jgi:hypothetical protein
LKNSLKEITLNIHAEQFSDEEKQIKIHGHCHPHVSSVEATFTMLNVP